ncbi:hypothetical protein [Vibrio hangzhouensis]|uniref:Uncharacterized protein n=1 Tax=Vibrio hangzhouensis TaxID=462991 RepID=A0A1H5SY36_9VIBR|nr:hypothetical protein [Vibrio hangzhouensis]SEF55374.1 hypothetical protein SAMN04488244_10244 [Vibrio hangzhouensis]
MKKSHLGKAVSRDIRLRHKRKLVALSFYISVFVSSAVIGCSVKSDVTINRLAESSTMASGPMTVALTDITGTSRN